MRPTRSFVTLSLLALLLGWPGGGAYAQEAEGPEQDPALNNLVHPEGYETAPPGELGRVETRGSGPGELVLVAGTGLGVDAYGRFVAEHRYEGTPAPPMPPEGTSYGEATWIRGAADGIAEVIEERGLEDPVVLGHFYPGGRWPSGRRSAIPDVSGA